MGYTTLHEFGVWIAVAAVRAMLVADDRNEAPFLIVDYLRFAFTHHILIYMRGCDASREGSEHLAVFILWTIITREDSSSGAILLLAATEAWSVRLLETMRWFTARVYRREEDNISMALSHAQISFYINKAFSMFIVFLEMVGVEESKEAGSAALVVTGAILVFNIAKVILTEIIHSRSFIPAVKASTIYFEVLAQHLALLAFLWNVPLERIRNFAEEDYGMDDEQFTSFRVAYLLNMSFVASIIHFIFLRLFRLKFRGVVVRLVFFVACFVVLYWDWKQGAADVDGSEYQSPNKNYESLNEIPDGFLDS